MSTRAFISTSTCLAIAALLSMQATGREAQFQPSNRLSGMGVMRGDLSPELLARRTELMTESQTFAILRDPRSVAGANRITSPALQTLFKDAEKQSGVPGSLIAAISYLESWGEANAQSPAGPKGIMQIAAATARSMGLRITYAKRYRVTAERRAVKTKKGTTYRTVKRRVPYTVLVSDERMIPRKAIPAAGRYLARLSEKFGGEDWAVFAYHCGEGCAQEMQSLVARADGLPKRATVAAMFFGASPARNRELHEALRHHMERDFSPTYYFRIKRAQQLIDLYRSDRPAFLKLAQEYRNEAEPETRAPHRLAVWLKPQDVLYQTCDDVRRDLGRGLVRAFDDSPFFGFDIGPAGRNAAAWDGPNRDYYLSASPAALGTLLYIAYETRRLHEAMRPKGERFAPLEVSALVRTVDTVVKEEMPRKSEAHSHCTGHVFDIDYGDMPRGQLEALRFILDDMGWMGYLGFVEETPNSRTFHIGSSPSSREFFLKIYEEAYSLIRS